MNEIISYASDMAGVIILGMPVMRLQYLPPLARYALVGSSLGLLMSSRYADADHSTHAAIFATGGAMTMIVVAARHLREFSPAA